MTFPAYLDAPPPRYISTLVDDRASTSGSPCSFLIPFGNKGQALVDILWHELPFTCANSVGELGPLNELARMILEIQNDREEDSPPTDYAISQALTLVGVSSELLAQRWKLPRVATDGYGGLRLSWKENLREVRAVITGSREKERYLYWEGQSGYGSISNFTAVTLFSYLDRLLGGKEFARAGAAVGTPDRATLRAANRMP